MSTTASPVKLVSTPKPEWHGPNKLYQPLIGPPVTSGTHPPNDFRGTVQTEAQSIEAQFLRERAQMLWDTGKITFRWPYLDQPHFGKTYAYACPRFLDPRLRTKGYEYAKTRELMAYKDKYPPKVKRKNSLSRSARDISKLQEDLMNVEERDTRRPVSAQRGRSSLPGFSHTKLQRERRPETAPAVSRPLGYSQHQGQTRSPCPIVCRCYDAPRPKWYHERPGHLENSENESWTSFLLMDDDFTLPPPSHNFSNIFDDPDDAKVDFGSFSRHMTK